jgi:DnaJ domain
MDRPCQLFGEQHINAALAGDAAFARKSSSDHLHPKVAFPLGPGTGMTGMAVRLVDDRQADGLQPGGELLANSVGDAHGVKAGKWRGPCQEAAHCCAAALVRLRGAPHTLFMPRASIEESAGPTAAAAATRLCDHPGCAASGDYRAPRSRDRLRQFYWFCLDHVRAYNAQWNYYAGMSAAEIEAEIRNDTVWQRPTWPLGGRFGVFRSRVRDFGMFGFEEEDERSARKRPLTEEEQALVVFDLTPPITFAGLKSRYKELVKLHHPDAHGGDKAAEERLKVIIRAYATLKASYFPSG